MRIISPEKRKQLEDCTWLRDMHVSQLYSIVELSKIIGVTPATVARALKQCGITSPSQQALREATVKRKYGVSNVGEIQIFREKAHATMVDKFGGHNWSSTVNQEARRSTFLARYGNIFPSRSSVVKQRTLQTNRQRYGRDHANQKHLSDECYNKITDRSWLYDQHVIQQKTQLQIATELGFTDITPTNTSTVSRAMGKLNIPVHHFQRSFEESQLADFVRSLGVEVITNARDIIPPKELDIYIPQNNIAIEYCGIYWHSDQFRSRHYHLDKLNDCSSKGIRLITIFSDEWINTPEIVKAKISAIMGIRRDRIYARQCTLCEISIPQRKQFLDMYHIQQDGPGSVNHGLFYNGELVSVMTFINKSNGNWVLNRFASSIQVVGGFSKLLSHFKKTNSWTLIISFADRRWSVGGVYESTGFALDAVLLPDYYWVNGNTRYHKFNYRHTQMKNKLINYDSSLSETENMTNHGFSKVWNCGLLRYVMKNVI